MYKSRNKKNRIKFKSKTEKPKLLFYNNEMEELKQNQKMTSIINKNRNLIISTAIKSLQSSLSKIRKSLTFEPHYLLRKQNDLFIKRYHQFSKNLAPIDQVANETAELYHNKKYNLPNLKTNLFKRNLLVENRKATENNYYSIMEINHKSCEVSNPYKMLTYLDKLKKIVNPNDNEEVIKITKSSKKISKKSIKRISKKLKKMKNKNKNIIKKDIKKESKKSKEVPNLIQSINNLKKLIYKTESSSAIKNAYILNKKYEDIYNDNHRDKLAKEVMEENFSDRRYISKHKTSMNIDLHEGKGITQDFERNNTSKFRSSTKIIKLNEQSYIKKFEKESPSSNPNLILITPKKTSKSNSTKITNTNTHSDENYILSKNLKLKDIPSIKLKETFDSAKTHEKYSYLGNEVSPFRTTYTSNMKEERLNTDKKINLKLLTPIKELQKDEEKENFLSKLYKAMNDRNIGNIDKKVDKYLIKYKKFDKNQIRLLRSKYDYKNTKLNIEELKNLIDSKNIVKKTFKIYLDNQDNNRIVPLIDELTEQENKITNFKNIISNIYNNNF